VIPVSEDPLHFTVKEFRKILSADSAEKAGIGQDVWNALTGYNRSVTEVDTYEKEGITNLGIIDRRSNKILFEWELAPYDKTHRDLRCTHFMKEDIDSLKETILSGKAIGKRIGHSLFEDADFSGIVGCSFRAYRSVFRGNIDFSGMVFASGSVFSGSRFKRSADFNGARFNGEAGFDNVRFCNKASFDNVRFTYVAYFNNTFFERNVTFNNALFESDARIRAWFRLYSDFAGARFIRGADFSGSVFRKTVNFDGTVFEGPTNFKDTGIDIAELKNTTFNWVHSKKEREKSGEEDG
jgi:uncharacterized protein YjbI with pentapeptide repeats